LNLAVDQKVISSEAANLAVCAAIEEAVKLDIKINVEVVDSSGLPMAFLRMTGAYIHSIEIAKDKAFTASSFGLATNEWESIFKDNPILKVGIPTRARLVVFGGGLPIKNGDDIIGAIGVSGGSEKQDIQCAEAGTKALRNFNL